MIRTCKNTAVIVCCQVDDIVTKYILGLLNFRQPDLALKYVIVLSSGSPKLPVLVFYHLLLTSEYGADLPQIAK